MADKARRPYARLEDDEYSSTRPAKGLSRSLFRNPSRYIRAALGKESEFEKPYYDFEQRLMHLEFPDPDWPGPWSPNFPSYEPKPRHPKDPLCPRCSITIWTFNTEVCEDDPLHRDYCAHGQVCVPVSYSICHTPEDTQYFRDHGTVLPGAEQRAWDAGELHITVGRGVALERVPEDEEPFGLLGEIKAACYRPAEGASWPEGLTEVTAVFVDMYGNNCEGYTTVYCEPCVNECCTDPAYVSPTNDTSITPETIAQSSEVTIAIRDGCAKFTWAVSGTGFTLQYSKTSGRENKLITDGTACGTATITVTDDCGNVASISVRCTTGQWVLACSGDNSAGRCATYGGGSGTILYSYPTSGYRYRQTVGCHYTPYNCIYYTCTDDEGVSHTSFIPYADYPEVHCGNDLGGTPIPIDCDLQDAGCVHANVHLWVDRWTC